MYLFGRNLCHNKLLARICSITIPRICYSEVAKMSSDLFEPPNEIKAMRTPLIIMHGLLGSKQNWRSISKSLAKKTNRRIYTVDARNHGDSPHTTEHNFICMSMDVIDFIRTRNLNKACLMGHSMGGRTMMYCALKYPEFVERLIVVDISPLDLPHDILTLRNIIQSMLNINISPDKSMADGRRLIKAQLQESISSTETIDFIMLNLRKRPDNGEFFWAANIKLLADSINQFDKFRHQITNLPAYLGPTIFICGTKSGFVRREDWPQIQKYFPNSEIHWLDAGHLVHFEQPQQFVGIVTEFLNR